MDEKRYVIYVHTIPKEYTGTGYDKRYVGMTSKKYEARWEHGFGYRSNKAFFDDICACGWDNVKHDILYQNLTFDEACEKEKEVIALYNSTDPERGYNKALGGLGPLGIKMPEEEKERRSKVYSGEGNPFFGKKHTEETRKKMSENHCDCGGANNSRAHKVYQFDLEMNFVAEHCTALQAAKSMGLTDMSIHVAASKKGSSCDYYWLYEEDVVIDNGVPRPREQFKFKRGFKSVTQYDVDGNKIKTYRTVTDAQKATGAFRQSICRVAKQGWGTAGGYCWKYEVAI